MAERTKEFFSAENVKKIMYEGEEKFNKFLAYAKKNEAIGKAAINFVKNDADLHGYLFTLLLSSQCKPHLFKQILTYGFINGYLFALEKEGKKDEVR